MMLKSGLMAFAMVGAMGLTAYAGDKEKSNESRIISNIKKDAQLQDVKVKYERIVTLTGKVATESDRARAERLANASGTARVDNQIEVSADLAKDRIDDSAAIQKDRIDRKAQLAKDRVAQKEQPTKTSIADDVSDSWITTKLKAQYLSESAFKGSSIQVDTEAKGLVKLSGTVPSESAHFKALEVARNTKGVRHVKDELKVAVNR